MTPMVTAAEALLFTPFTGGLLLVIVYAVAYVARRDREESDRLPEDAELRHQWPDLDADLDREAEQRHRALAPRRRGQDLPAVQSIGHQSLDEIRREFGGAS